MSSQDRTMMSPSDVVVDEPGLHAPAWKITVPSCPGGGVYCGTGV